MNDDPARHHSVHDTAETVLSMSIDMRAYKLTYSRSQEIDIIKLDTRGQSTGDKTAIKG